VIVATSAVVLANSNLILSGDTSVNNKHLIKEFYRNLYENVITTF
jgi:hypothetical protein